VPRALFCSLVLVYTAVFHPPPGQSLCFSLLVERALLLFNLSSLPFSSLGSPFLCESSPLSCEPIGSHQILWPLRCFVSGVLRSSSARCQLLHVGLFFVRVFAARAPRYRVATTSVGFFESRQPVVPAMLRSCDFSPSRLGFAPQSIAGSGRASDMFSFA
jgi:hypothetical protein